MKNEFLWNMGDVLDSMRLIVEGAVVLFEEDASPLTRLAQDNDELVAGTDQRGAILSAITGKRSAESAYRGSQPSADGK